MYVVEQLHSVLLRALLSINPHPLCFECNTAGQLELQIEEFPRWLHYQVQYVCVLNTDRQKVCVCVEEVLGFVSFEIFVFYSEK